MHAQKHVAQPPVKSASCANKKIKPFPVGAMHAKKHVGKKVTGRTEKEYVALVCQIAMNLICLALCLCVLYYANQVSLPSLDICVYSRLKTRFD